MENTAMLDPRLQTLGGMFAQAGASTLAVTSHITRRFRSLSPSLTVSMLAATTSGGGRELAARAA